MNRPKSLLWSAAGAVLFMAAALSVCGCTTEAEFQLNQAYLRKQEKSFYKEGESFHFDRQYVRDISDILVGLFGTPDEPSFPKLGDPKLDVVQLDRLQIASGSVGSDQDGAPRGLYREHCAHCHGVTGDGLGPTAAFLNPYPRNYRKGIFKFKSTKRGVKPTHDDLKRILELGIPGTAMPSFVLLSEPELDALVDYVKYLAIRGEVERKLIEELATDVDFEAGERLIDVAAKEGSLSEYNRQINRINSIVERVVQGWADAESMPVPARPAAWHDDPHLLEEKIARGRELFLGKLDCKKCHGVAALGDGETSDYDDWTKDIFAIDQVTKQPKPSELQEFAALGALHPRNILPRNLRQGIFRGGRRPIDIFWRVKNGIEGTPMPEAPGGFADEDIWCVVEYVRSLPYEPLSQPQKHRPENRKKTL